MTALAVLSAWLAGLLPRSGARMIRTHLRSTRRAHSRRVLSCEPSGSPVLSQNRERERNYPMHNFTENLHHFAEGIYHLRYWVGAVGVVCGIGIAKGW